KAGFSIYQRSGPINPQTFVYALPQGTSYKGQTSVNLRADHGMYGLMLAPTFQIPGAPAWQIDVPLIAGNVGAGFYLFGEDRMTPDGRRVSEWENDLLGGRDSDFAWAFEGGVRLIVPTGQRESRLALGLHYTRVLGWETVIQPQSYYDGKLRVSLALLMGNL
ncbi:MAG: hypothetical protein EAZ89_15130, partial [Bacteroidetes bacterium]